MEREQIVLVRTRARELFKGGDFDHDEIMHLWMRRMASREYTLERAMRALDQYAVRHGGSKGKFIVGQFMRFVDAESRDEPRTVLVDRAALRREAELKLARQAEQDAATAEAIEADRRVVTQADPAAVNQIINDLISWGAPPLRVAPSSLPRPWRMAVADILLDRIRAAPTEAGYYEQVRDDTGAWVDDPSRPLRPLPAREWWRLYGAAGLAARGVLGVV